MTKVDLIFLCIGLLIFGFIFGWLFPIEGPIDYVYDEAVKKKAPVKAAPKSIKEVQIDLNNEEELVIHFMPLTITEKELF